MADKHYVVTSHGVLVNCDGAASTLLQRGAVLPPNADAEQIQHMLELGLVEEREHIGGLEPALTLYTGPGSSFTPAGRAAVQ